MDCLFCDITNKKRSAHIIYEDGAAISVLDVMPRAQGHALVLPKKHVETILDIPDADMGGLWMSVKKTTELLKRTLSCDGFTIGINHGKVSGQAVEHLHIHIIPRFHGDGGGSIHGVVNAPSSLSLDEVEQKIIGVSR